jgi:hypothetical protein
MSPDEKRIAKREYVANSKLLSTTILTTAKSNTCKLVNISNSGLQVLCKEDFQLNNKIVSGMFKYNRKGQKDKIINSFMAEIVWDKLLENKELLVGLKFHTINDNIGSQILKL